MLTPFKPMFSSREFEIQNSFRSELYDYCVWKGDRYANPLNQNSTLPSRNLDFIMQENNKRLQIWLEERERNDFFPSGLSFSHTKKHENIDFQISLSVAG